MWNAADKERLAAARKKSGERSQAPFFARDAENLLAAEACVIIGTKLQRLKTPGCNRYGYDGCQADAAFGARCVLNVGDLGIALGSAVSIAADCRVDCRTMYTVGQAAVQLHRLGPEVKMAHGIPLSIQEKNIFFDRG